MVKIHLYSSPLPSPFHHIAVHNWLEVDYGSDGLYRWEVWDKSSSCPTSWGHVHQNLLPSKIGMPRRFFRSSNDNVGYWDARLEGTLTGKIAETMGTFIESNCPSYPFKDQYHFWPGPNSNTFIQWILNSVSGHTLQLPPLSFGKNYRVPNQFN